MRAVVPDFDIVTPDSLKEALELLASKPDFYRPLAGGTDLMVVFNAGHQQYKNMLSLHKLKELHGINVTDDEVEIKALSTYTDMRYHPVLQKEFPMLCQAAAESGAVVKVKKGQFLAPWDMKHVVAKLTGAGARNVLVTERGVSWPS